MSFFSNLSTLFGSTQTPSQPAPAAGQKKAARPNQGRPSNHRPPQAQGKKPAGPKKPTTNNQSPKSNFRQPAAKPAPQVASVMSDAEINQLRAQLKQQYTRQAEVEAESIVREAQSKAREIIVEAKDEALTTRSHADKEAQVIIRQAEEQQKDLTIKIDRIDQRLSQLDDKEKAIEQEKARLSKVRAEVEKNNEESLQKLEQISGLSRADAHQKLLDDLAKTMNQEMAQFITLKEEDARVEADNKAKEIIIEAMKYGATDYVPEYTSSSVALGSEDAKGKIIGKNGRNIHTFERITGVDVDLDVSPTEVKLSSFDPVRREVAKVALEKLIKDGRIQPARIEEVVAKTQKEINKITFDEGRNLCHSLGIYNLPNELMQILGRFKYRFSYGQNLIAHTLEVTRIGVKIAHELGLNVNVVKLGCLLHDIGKVSEEVEGSHVELGVKIAKRFNLPKEVIAAIAEHHEDEPFSSFESMAVHIADAISGARPGARYENYDEYVQRLQQLEEIANSYPEVNKSYAIQAGREIRVILEPAKSKDDDVIVLANRIRDQIKEQLTYPGTVTVTVIREERGQAVAN